MIPAGLCSWPFHLLLLLPCQISSCIQPRASCYNPCDKNTHHTIQEVIFSLCRKTPLQGTGLAELFSLKDFVLSTKREKHTTDFMHPVQLLFSLTRLLKFSRKCQIPWAAQGQQERFRTALPLFTLCFFHPSFTRGERQNNSYAEPLVISHDQQLILEVFFMS